MSEAYEDFLARKALRVPATGMRRHEIPRLSPHLRQFQRVIVEWALRRGRAAAFCDTGLGKTIMQLSWAQAVRRHTDGRVLILTPLAVAEQTVQEAAKFGIGGVSYASSGIFAKHDIVITNYDRLHRFDPDDYAGIVLDEASIIKSHDSKMRAQLTEVFRDTPWKLECSATPAPNDFKELGNHAEFIGAMTEKEMLSMFFVHDGSIRANTDDRNRTAGSDGWRLKRHAEQDFWRWLASWAVVIRNPRDLGPEFAEDGYDLVPIRHHQITVSAVYQPRAGSDVLPQGSLFPLEARTMRERLSVRKDSIDGRVTAAADLVRSGSGPWIIWCNLNKEADAINDAIPGSVEVRGSDDPEEKKRNLLSFCQGKIPVLVSKASIAGFGLNMQVCSSMIFVGLNDSFEQLYQAKRRCWRYGQTRPVDVYMIASELEGAVVANLERKEHDFETMQDALVGHMRALLRDELLSDNRRERDEYAPAKQMEMPAWL
jgi:hypothetical protein